MMNTIADFCELFALIERRHPQSTTASASRQRRLLMTPLKDDMDDSECNDVPTLLSIDDDSRSSSSSSLDYGELSDSSDTESAADLNLLEEGGCIDIPSSRHVTFNEQVAVREFAVVVAQHALMDVGDLPLQLDWRFTNDTLPRHICSSKHRGLSYEPPPRMTLAMRRERLIQVGGYTEQDLDAIVGQSSSMSGDDPNSFWNQIYTWVA
jgi:hypothetical protein